METSGGKCDHGVREDWGRGEEPFWRKVLPPFPKPHPPFSKDFHPYRIPPLSLTLRQQSKALSFFFKKKRQRRGKPPNRDSIKTKVLGGWGWGLGRGKGPFSKR
ncbi:hypothetical protein, partial [uncultured Bilophila sp.]|uniref:hypothetical protein n=1 Tax=uncultured Bilophila sp. TaxID=529385 RepID=UPI0025951413